MEADTPLQQKHLLAKLDWALVGGGLPVDAVGYCCGGGLVPDHWRGSDGGGCCGTPVSPRQS